MIDFRQDAKRITVNRDHDEGIVIIFYNKYPHEDGSSLWLGVVRIILDNNYMFTINNIKSKEIELLINSNLFVINSETNGYITFQLTDFGLLQLL